MIAHLRKRLLSSDGFPHEIGIFLGYPLEDVIDFADTKEKDASFAATGRYTMTRTGQGAVPAYDRARDCAVRELLQGKGMSEIAVRAA